jgi:hypothetical protein
MPQHNKRKGGKHSTGSVVFSTHPKSQGGVPECLLKLQTCNRFLSLSPALVDDEGNNMEKVCGTTRRIGLLHLFAFCNQPAVRGRAARVFAHLGRIYLQGNLVPVSDQNGRMNRLLQE